MAKTYDEFVEFAKAVRKAQKSFFKTKSIVDLHKSKELEAELDRQIKEHEESKKPKLF